MRSLISSPTATLVEALSSSSESARAEAARLLGERRAVEAFESLVEALREAASGEFFVSLCYALGALGDQRASDVLVAAYRRAKTTLYQLAPLRALAVLDVVGCLPLFLEALGAPEGSPLREIAAEALAKSGLEEAVSPLVEAFATATSPKKLSEALRQLGEAHPELLVGEAIATRLLLGEPCAPIIYLEATRLFSSLKTKAAEEILKSWSEGESPLLRRAAKKALKELQR